MMNIFNERTAITEKMLVFWHNHFATESINDPNFDYNYFSLIRKHVLGNFRAFTKDMTINPSMLRFLNGNQNTKNAPNENFARELLELFTIGKGELTGEGDYTNYTEEDISEIARILTGWKDQGFKTKEQLEISAFFRSWAHDTETKTLSHRFDNISINDAGEEEYKQLIDIIFSKKEVARFISRKLYRYFIYHVIDEQTEAQIIEPLAGILVEADYEIKAALEVLLSSQHFYDFANIGCLIKNPLDFIFSSLKSLETEIPTEDLNINYSFFFKIHSKAGLMQMNYGDPPGVAGWKAYYQLPSYYEIWINSVTLPYRMALTKDLALDGIKQGSYRITIPCLKLLESLDTPSNIDVLINHFNTLLLPQEITEKQRVFLKDILIPGLPDYEWTVEYVNYLDNQDDENLVKSLENKLRQFISSILTMPEFYLS